MTGASIVTTTIPTIVGMAVVGKALETIHRVSERNGRPFGSTHWHYKGKRAVSHRHEGGHMSHTHRGLRGYGKSRSTLRR